MSKIANDGLTPFWHRMLYSCTDMATAGIKGLTWPLINNCGSIPNDPVPGRLTPGSESNTTISPAAAGKLSSRSVILITDLGDAKRPDKAHHRAIERIIGCRCHTNMSPMKNYPGSEPAMTFV